MSDNGHEPEKETPIRTPEELAELRLERYKENSANFIEVADLAFAAVKIPNSHWISIFIGNVSRTQLDIAQVELNHTVNKIRLRMDIESEMKQEAAKKIIPGGIMNFARRKDN